MYKFCSILILLGLLVVPAVHGVGESPATGQTETAVTQAETEDGEVDSDEASAIAACEAAETSIREIIDEQTKRVDRYLEFLTNAQEQVDAFFLQQDLSSEDYDTAHEAATDGYDTAAELFDSLLQQAEQFGCDEQPARQVITPYRENYAELIVSLENYRDSLVDMVNEVQAAMDSRPLDTVHDDTQAEDEDNEEVSE